MGPIPSSKGMATGVIILVLLNVATTTLAASTLDGSKLAELKLAATSANSTDVASEKDITSVLCAEIALNYHCSCHYIDHCCYFNYDCTILGIGAGQCCGSAYLQFVLFGVPLPVKKDTGTK